MAGPCPLLAGWIVLALGCEDPGPDSLWLPIIGGSADASSGAPWSVARIALGDLDEDGVLDIAAAGSGSSSSAIFTLDGSVLQQGQTLSADATDVAIGDVDGDLDLDLVLARGGSSPGPLPVEVWTNDGGVLTLASSLPARDGRGVALADLDGDGNLDIALAVAGGPDEVLLGDGVLGWTPSWDSGTTSTSTSVAAADADLDGDVDLAFSHLGDVDRVWENVGGGSFTLAWSSGTAGDTWDLAWADSGGDGFPELARARGPAAGSDIRWNDGNLGFASAWAHAAGPSDRGVAWGRMVGSAFLELAAADAAGASRVDYVRATGFTAGPTFVESSDLASDIAWGDLDHDGWPDVVKSNQGQPLRFYTGQSWPPQVTWTGTLLEPGLTADAGDHDGDGDLDLVVAGGDPNTFDPYPTRVYELVDGVPVLAWSAPVAQAVFPVAWGDADGDGLLDILEGHMTTPTRVWRNTGSGFTPLWTAPSAMYAGPVAWGDLDGDGDLDFLSHTGGGVPLQAWMNDGSGSFSLGWQSAETDIGLSIDLADWDRDGDLDIATGAWDGPLRVYEGAGDGTFAPVWASASARWEGAQWMDADGDGAVDLFTSDGLFGLRLFRNTGGSLSLWWSSAVAAARRIDPVDWDEDGDIDVSVARYAAEPGWWLNDGTGQFTRFAVGLVGHPAQFAQSLDADRDGDPDTFIVTSDNAADVLLTNRRFGEHQLPDDPTRVILDGPGVTGGVDDDLGVGQVLLGPTIPITFRIKDEESDPAPRVRVFYSPVGGGQWLPATVAGPTEDLASTPEGEPHTLWWNLAADGAEGDTLAVRVVITHQSPRRVTAPIQVGEVGTTSGWFRAYPSCFPLDADHDGHRCEVDCDEANGDIHPGAPEVEDDAIDQDCSGADAVTCWVDADGDGYGGASTAVDPDGSCVDDALQSGSGGDCDDASSARVPGAAEICDGLDNDCDGFSAGEGDADGDGALTCADCDEAAPAIHPGAAELCDGFDTDCDAGTGGAELDIDGDTVLSCVDCDDLSPATYPGAPEICDAVDQDCGGPDPDEEDGDGDGTAPCGGDCDDASAGVGPDAPELCDGLDQDCDLMPGPPAEDDPDGDGSSACEGDCAALDPRQAPGRTEVCDGLDSDCVSGVPAAETDGDGDGFPPCLGDCDDANAAVYPAAPESPSSLLDSNCDGVLGDSDLDQDGITLGNGDCHDGDPAIHPGAVEACDGWDSDCVGGPGIEELRDTDGDGSVDCLDCGPANPAIHPGAAEECDGIDGDCDGRPADGGEQDLDDDGARGCGGDCDDDDARVRPGLGEDCADGVDNDCDGTVDQDTDTDQDGAGACTGDCRDLDESVFPGAAETCNGLDDDCDGAVDDGWDADGDGQAPCQGDCLDTEPTVYLRAPAICGDALDNDCLPTTLETEDADGDGFAACDSPLGDCWEGNPLIHPSAIEDCDGLDNDCDGLVDEAWDGDGDGFPACGFDCDDSLSSTHPEAAEVCADGLDQDCNGVADEGCPEPPREGPPPPPSAPGIAVRCDHAGPGASLGAAFVLGAMGTRRRRHSRARGRAAAVAALLGAGLTAGPALAQEPDGDGALALAALDAVNESCTDASDTRDISRSIAARGRITEAMARLSERIDSGGPTWLRYWRAKLGLCIGVREFVVADLESFTAAERANPTFRHMVKDAERMLRIHRTPESFRGWAFGPRATFAGGGTVTVPNGFLYGGGRWTTAIRLGRSPVQLQLGGRIARGPRLADADGAPSEFVALHLAFEVGLAARIPIGSLGLELGGALVVVANPLAGAEPSPEAPWPASEGGRVLLGPVGRIALHVPFGQAPVGLRVVIDGGANIPFPTVCGGLELAFAAPER